MGCCPRANILDRPVVWGIEMTSKLIAYSALVFLISGGGLSALGVWGQMAAYLIALGLLLLVVDFARQIMAQW